MRRLFELLSEGEFFFPHNLYPVQTNPIRQLYLLAAMQKLSRIKKGPVTFLEIGCWMGASSIVLGYGIKKFFDGNGKLFCVDAWKPYFGTTKGCSYDESNSDIIKDKALGMDVVFDIFKYNINRSGFDFVTPMIGDSRTILPMLKEESFDLIYVDGNHLYEYVKADIRNAKRLIAEGGIICGDDLEVGYGARPFDPELLEKQCVHEEGEAFSFHPGVTQAAWEELGLNKSYGGLWLAQKVDGAFAEVSLEDCTAYKPPFIIDDKWQKQFDQYIEELKKIKADDDVQKVS